MLVNVKLIFKFKLDYDIKLRIKYFLKKNAKIYTYIISFVCY